MNRIFRIFRLLSKIEQRRFFYLILFTLFGVVLEIIGISSVPVFFEFFSNPAKVSIFAPAVDGIKNWLSWEVNLFLIFAILIVIFFFVKNFILRLILKYQTRYIYDIQTRLNSSLYEMYMKAPYKFHLNINSAELQRNLSETRNLVLHVLSPLVIVLMEFIMVLCIGTFLFVVQPLITTIVLIFFAVVGLLFMTRYRKEMRQVGQEQLTIREELIRATIEGLNNVKILKVLNREHYYIDLYRGKLTDQSLAMQRNSIVASMPKYLIESLAVMTIITIAIVAHVIYGELTPVLSILFLFAGALIKLMPAIYALTSNSTKVQFYLPSIDVVAGHFEKFSEQKKKTLPVELTSATIPSTEVVIRDLHFVYGQDSKFSLNNVSLSISKGSAVAFVGHSGAGKSTLIDILLGVLYPDTGNIFYAGRSIYADMKQWQSRIGYVPQNIYLIDASVRRNIALGIAESEIDEEKFRKALKLSQLEDVVNNLPEKEFTAIGENGVRLSGGQRQRIGIARALYHQPEVLILDEATSALDNLTEKFIVDEIKLLKGKMTVIIIAHRLTTVKNCDQIFLLDKGSIKAAGDYESLIENSLEFQKMALIK